MGSGGSSWEFQYLMRPQETPFMRRRIIRRLTKVTRLHEGYRIISEVHLTKNSKAPSPTVQKKPGERKISSPTPPHPQLVQFSIYVVSLSTSARSGRTAKTTTDGWTVDRVLSWPSDTLDCCSVHSCLPEKRIVYKCMYIQPTPAVRTNGQDTEWPQSDPKRNRRCLGATLSGGASNK